MSDIFLNSQDSLADPFTIDPDDSALSHPSLSATRIHEKRLSQSIPPTGGYFRVTDDPECHERLKGFTV